MSFSYQSSAASNENIEINAILENPNSWKKTVNVVPQKTYSGNASIPFSVDLKYFQDLADTINKEIPLTNIHSYNLTIQAIVSGGELSSGGIDQHSIQLLPIIVTGAFIKIGSNLTYAGSDAVGTFDYQVKLSDNTLFGPATLTAPTSPANTPGKVLGPGDTIFSRLVDSMNVSFTYSLTADKAIRQVAHEVKIEKTSRTSVFAQLRRVPRAFLQASRHHQPSTVQLQTMGKFFAIEPVAQTPSHICDIGW